MVKPAVLVIPGSASPAGLYEPLVDSLRALDYEVYAIPLQTVGRRPRPAPNMLSDAAFIATETRKLVHAGRHVAIVAHSYGGLPMTQSVKNLTIKERAAQGLQGGVSHLVYISAQAPEVGAAQIGADISFLPEYVKNGSEEYLGTETADLMAPRAFSEWDEEKAKGFGKGLQPQAASIFFDQLSWPGYDYVECTYMVCTQDQIVEPKVSQACIEVLRKHSPKVHVVEFEAGHCPMFTQLDKFVVTLKGILEKAEVTE